MRTISEILLSKDSIIVVIDDAGTERELRFTRQEVTSEGRGTIGVIGTLSDFLWKSDPSLHLEMEDIVRRLYSFQRKLNQT